jgi:hypothetical protein
MSAVVSDRQVDPQLADAFLAHLTKQLESADRMLAVVHEQGAAIRRRDVQNVVRLAGALQVEMHRREVVEAERERLLGRAADSLGLDPDSVNLHSFEELMGYEMALLARAQTIQLASILEAIQREHHTNRVLMSQEMAFLDYLLRLAGSGGSGAYDSGADDSMRSGVNTHTRRRVFDLEA